MYVAKTDSDAMPIGPLRMEVGSRKYCSQDSFVFKDYLPGCNHSCTSPMLGP